MNIVNYPIFRKYKTPIINENNIDKKKALLKKALSSIKSNNSVERELLNSLMPIGLDNDPIKSMKYEKLKIYLDIFDTVEYYDDAIKILEDIETNCNDVAQINTFKRIIKNKPSKQCIENDKNVVKKCPHCNYGNIGPQNSIYKICGYNDKGYDWIGCGKDWCFRCGKRLCKSWTNNMLFNISNRCHDSKCCKNYALKHNLIYPNDFCMCHSFFVNRL